MGKAPRPLPQPRPCREVPLRNVPAPTLDTELLHHRRVYDTIQQQDSQRVVANNVCPPQQEYRVAANTVYPSLSAGMKPLIIGIAGGTGSGKSTVARKVAEALPDASVAFLEMDAYYRDFRHLTQPQLQHVNWDHPDAFDVELLTTHLGTLSRGEIGRAHV